MRRFIILLSLMMVLLAACAPAIPAGSNNPQEEPVDNPVAQPAEEQPDPGERQSDGARTDGPAAPSNAPLPELIWDDAPENVVISATFCCGFAPRLAVTNYIPDATVFGDGRIIWTTIDETGGRQVFEAQLSPEALELLLSQVAEAGFFGWEDRYADLSIADAADQCIQVNLDSVSKSVCEYVKGAPEAFHELYEELTNGTGAEGKPFIPETAFLTVENLGSDLNLGDQKVNALDEATLGFTLEKAQQGVWIEGTALAQLWQEVNAKPWLPLVEDGQAFFQLGLQVPGLSSRSAPSAVTRFGGRSFFSPKLPGGGGKHARPLHFREVHLLYQQ